MALWIDLTDFLKWTGNLTGIQRIQYNLSKRYIESGRDVRFFVHHESTHSFSQVDFDPMEIVRSGIISEASKSPAVGRSTISRRILNRIRRGRGMSGTTGNVPISPFLRGDTVFVLGGIWVGGFIDDLIACKITHGLKFIHFAFDMIPTLFPGYVVEWLPEAFTKYQKTVFTHADGIVAISQSTANDVRDFMRDHGIKNKPHIGVVRIGEVLGGDEGHKAEAVDVLRGKEYILSVSTIEGRKNHAALFYVLKEAKRRNIDLPMIVIVGRNGWLTDDIRYTMQHDVDAAEGISVMNGVSDTQLSWLYQHCRFTIFPSFYEGWGMPIAESLTCGKLCLASNTSSMPEIAGDLIDYFSPYDTGDILRCIVKYMDDEALKTKEGKIKESYHPTSWDDMFSAVSLFVDQQ